MGSSFARAGAAVLSRSHRAGHAARSIRALACAPIEQALRSLAPVPRASGTCRTPWLRAGASVAAVCSLAPIKYDKGAG